MPRHATAVHLGLICGLTLVSTMAWGQGATLIWSGGTLTVEGAGSKWTNTGALFERDGNLPVGRVRPGTVNILNGAALEGTGLTRIGLDLLSQGTVIIDANSTWKQMVGPLHIGHRRTGTVEIKNQRTLESANAAIGALANSTGTFDWRNFNGGETDEFKNIATGNLDFTLVGNNALNIGDSLIRWYPSQNGGSGRMIDTVHILSHSAGTWLADAMAGGLRAAAMATEIHLTLFEAFDPPVGIRRQDGRRVIMADIAGFVEHGLGALLARLYSGTFPAYDVRLSRNVLFRFDRGPYTSESLTTHVDDLSGTNDVTSGDVQILPNGNRILRTSSPAVFTRLFETDQSFEFVEFDLEFLSENPRLLSVYFDGEQVFEFENEHFGVGPGDVLTSDWVWLGQEYAPGPYSLTFRLDPLREEQAALELSNRQLISLIRTPLLASLPGDYNGNGRVEQADLDLVLLNRGSDFSALPSTWVNAPPTEGIVDQAELDGVLLNWGSIAEAGLGAAAEVPNPATLLLAVAMSAAAFIRHRGHTVMAWATWLFAAILLSGHVDAATWTAGTGSWNVAENWLEMSVPTASQDAKINNGGTAELMQSAGARIVTLGGNAGEDGTLDVGPGQLTAQGLLVGIRGSGSLRISDFGRVSVPFSTIAFGANSQGTAAVSGEGSKWSFTDVGSLVVADFGNGTLHIQNGAVVEGRYGNIALSAGSTGEVVVDSYSRWTTTESFLVGGDGKGTLSITNGSTVEGTGLAVVANAPTSQGTVFIDSNSTWTQHGGPLHIGERGTATVEVRNHSMLETRDATVRVGGGRGGIVNVQGGSHLNIDNGDLTILNNGRVNVADTESRIDISNSSSANDRPNIDVGNTTGLGMLQITGGGGVEGGGPVRIDGLQGTLVLVDGDDSVLQASSLTVGRDAFGQLMIKRGGAVVVQNASIGVAENSTGEVIVSGGTAGTTQVSKWHTGSLNVGVAGTGRLEISDGGNVGSESAVVGVITSLTSDGVGVVNVDGPGSTWFVERLLILGDFGDGTLNLTNGGRLFVGGSVGVVGELQIGRNLGLGTKASVAVDGGGSRINVNGDLTVGNKGTGTLHITNSGSVVNQDGFIGLDSGSRGTAVVEHATWENRKGLSVGFLGTALLELREGGRVSAAESAIIGPLGKVTGIGTLTAPNVENYGIFAPGVSPGTLTIEGDFLQGDTGKLEIELASTTSYDVLAVTGQASLGGRLEISLLDGFMPAAGDTFEFLTAVSVSGAFDQILVMRDDAPAGMFDLTPMATGLMLSGFQAVGSMPLPGDYNASGRVEQADLDLVLLNWGGAFSALPSTWTSQRPTDGIVDQAELDGVLLNWGNTAAAGQGTVATVPEPQALLVAPLLAALAVGRRLWSLHRRGRQRAALATAVLLVAGLLSAGHAGSARAVTLTWTGGTGDWHVGENWRGKTTGFPNFTPLPPDNSDQAEIRNGGTAQVFDSAAVDGITIAEAGGMIDVGLGAQFNTQAAFLTASPGSEAVVRLLGPATWINRGLMNIGNAGAGRVEIHDGSELTNDADGPFFGFNSIELGREPGSEGTLIVNNNAKLTNIQHFTRGILVGAAGTGILEIASGGAIVDGQIIAGNSTLDIFPGGRVTSRFNTILTGSTATIERATWNNRNISVVGGTLNVNDGAIVSSSVGVAVSEPTSEPTGVMNVNAGGTITAAEDIVVLRRGSLNLADSGRIVISSDTSFLPPGNGLFVGSSMGKGTLEVRSGGTASAHAVAEIDGMEGTRVWVDGVRDGRPSRLELSNNLIVGNMKFGELSITSGGEVISSGIRVGIGIDGGSTGLVTVLGKSADGQRSLLVHDHLVVGSEGTGRLRILAGGEVRGKTASVGGVAGEVIVDGDQGSNSQWTLAEELRVGLDGDGSVILRNGGRLQVGSAELSGALYVGPDNLPSVEALSSPPIVTVTGAGSVLEVHGGLSVGGSNVFNDGVGGLHIADGGQVVNEGGLIGFHRGSIGTVLVDNAIWGNRAFLSVGQLGDGSLHLRNGGVVGARKIEIGRGGVFSGVGAAVKQDGVLLLINEGTVAPGESPGTLTIDGDYMQGETGRLEIELASTMSHDVLAVTGQATLGGTLEINLLDGFMPAASDTFDFLTAASVTGAFDQILVLRDDVPAGTFDLAVTPTGLMLSGFQAGGSMLLPGDYNASGRVEQADLDLVLLNWGGAFSTLPATWINARPSEGIVDQAELDGVLLNWGNSLTAAASPVKGPAGVPEPSTLVLFAAGITCSAAIFLRTNRRRHWTTASSK